MTGSSAPLSASSLIKLIAKSIPKEASPQLKSPYDAIAIAVHACLLAVGFKLVGLENEDILELSEDDASSLPNSWNETQNIAFRYSHPGSTMEYIVKVGRLGNNAVIDAIGLGDNRRASVDVPIDEYTSKSSFPADPIKGDSLDNNASAEKSIVDIFKSSTRLGDLAALIEAHILQRLQSNDRKEGVQALAETEDAPLYTRAEQPQSTHEPPPRVPPANNPNLDPTPEAPSLPTGSRPRVPAAGEEPPGFDDEYDIYRPPGRPQGQDIYRNPLSIGHDDLYPPGMGPNDPIRPHLGPGGLRAPGSGGGMHPSFDDPIFGGAQPGGPGHPQVPPGARYDPTFPGDPQGGPLGWPGAGHRGQGGPGGPGSGGFGGFPGGGFL